MVSRIFEFLCYITNLILVSLYFRFLRNYYFSVSLILQTESITSMKMVLLKQLASKKTRK
jgi:hypothetical protein